MKKQLAEINSDLEETARCWSESLTDSFLISRLACIHILCCPLISGLSDSIDMHCNRNPNNVRSSDGGCS